MNVALICNITLNIKSSRHSFVNKRFCLILSMFISFSTFSLVWDLTQKWRCRYEQKKKRI